MTTPLLAALGAALDARSSLLPGPDDHAALRLFHGFLEGFPSLSVELFGRTLVLHDHGKRGGNEDHARAALALVRERLPWVSSALWKIHTSRDAEERKGRMLLGEVEELADRVREGDAWYALDLRLNQDASLYLDTRGLRGWLLREARGKAVLNTFAYTGSLGVAALVGGASRVVQVDRSRAFLDVAVRSCKLNGLEAPRGSLVAADFFEHVGRLKKQGELFDVVIVDPPFFSETAQGRVDLVGEAHRVLNKARPLVGDGGALIAVNNALFLPGAAYHRMLEELGASGYLRIESLVEVPPDCTGFPGTTRGSPPSDPSPFNHTTKVAVLRVRRKDGRRASLSL
jgi:23S rRNA (cytosine1962-C5)-methyltransferase